MPTDLRKPSCVIVDLDGTLCDTSHRHDFLEQPEIDWEAYCQACDGDTLIEATYRLIHCLDEGLTIVYLTGRKDSARQKTIDWLDKRLLWFEQGQLIMRSKYDRRPNEYFKLDKIHSLQGVFDVRLVIDDHPKVAELIPQRLNIPVLQVTHSSNNPAEWGPEFRPQA